MSVTDVAPEAAPFVSDYVPGTVGHAVLAVGRDHGGAEAVAVWQVSPTGQPTGAWIVPTGTDDAGVAEETSGDGPAAKARRLLHIVERRSLVGWSHDDTGYALECLAGVADTAAPPDWAETAVYLPAALAEIVEYRQRYAAAVTEHQQVSKSKVAPLSWPHDVPTDVSSPAELAELAGLTVGTISSEVAGRVLLMSRLLAWTAGRWHETEQVRLRRRYLVERYGPASVLPPRWLGRLRAANGRGARQVESVPMR
jgi:Family of unknown function (DUF6218)